MGLNFNFLIYLLLVRATTVIIAQEPAQNGDQPSNTAISNEKIPSNSAALSGGDPLKSSVESQLTAPPLSFVDNAQFNGQNYPNFPFFDQSGIRQTGFGQSGQFQNQFTPPSQQFNGQQYPQSLKFGPAGLHQSQNQFGIPNQPKSSSFQMNPATKGQLSSEYYNFNLPQMQSTSPRYPSQFGPPRLGASFEPGSQQTDSPYGASSQHMGGSSGYQPFQVATMEGQTNQKSREGFMPPNYQIAGPGNFISPYQMMENPGRAMSQNSMSNAESSISPSPPNFQMPGSGGFGSPMPPNNLMSNFGSFLPSNPQMSGAGGFMPSFASIASAVIPSLMYMTTPGILLPSPPMFMQNPLNFYGQGPKPPQFPFGHPGRMNGGDGFNTMPGTAESGFNLQQPFNTMPSGSGFNFQTPFNGQPESNFPGYSRPQLFPLAGQMSQVFKPYQQQGTGPNNAIPKGVSRENGPHSEYYIIQNNDNNGTKNDNKPGDVGSIQTEKTGKDTEGIAPSINVSPNGKPLQGHQPVQSIALEGNSPKDGQQISSTAATAVINQNKNPSTSALQNIDTPPKVETNEGLSKGVGTTSEGVNNSDKAVATERDGIPDDLVVTNEEISKQGPFGDSIDHGSMSVGGTSTGLGNIGGGTNIAAKPPNSFQIQGGKSSGSPQASIGENGGSLSQSGLTAIEGDTDASLVVGEEGELAAGGGLLGNGGGHSSYVGGHSSSTGGSLAGGMGGQTGGSSGQNIKLVTVPVKKTQTITLQTVGSPAMKKGGATLHTAGSTAVKQGGTSNIKLITLPAQGKFMQQDGSSIMMQNGGGSNLGATGIKMYPGNLGNAARLSKYQMYPNSFLVTPIKTKLPRPSSHAILNESFSMEDMMNPLEQTMANQKQMSSRKMKTELRPNKTNVTTADPNNFRN